MEHHDLVLRPIGQVRSELKSTGASPRQGKEGAPDAWIDLDAAYVPGLDGMQPGAQLVVMTWLHRADRTLLRVHPRDDLSNPLTGVFCTRSADRPNPVGLHRVTLRSIAGASLLVGPLEAIDGTPIVDIKPVLAVADG